MVHSNTDEKQRKSIRKKRNFKLISGISLALIVAVSAYQNKEEKKKEREKDKQEQIKNDEISKEFAESIFDDINKWVNNKKNNAAILRAVEEYKRDPEKFNQQITELAKDSAKYADAIVRDASVIHKFDRNINGEIKKVSFEEAKKIIESQEALIYGPKHKATYKMGVSHGEEVIAGIDYVETGETEVKGSNNSPARKIKINKEHLADYSLELATLRAAKAKADRDK